MNPQKSLIITSAVLLTTAVAFVPDAFNVSVVRSLPLFVFAFGVVVWWFQAVLERGSFALKLSTLDLLVLLWVVVTGVSLLLSTYTGTGSEQFWILLASVMFYFLAENTFDSKSFERLLRVLVALAVALSIYGFVDVWVAKGAHRLDSTLGNPTTFATFMAMCLPFSLMLLFGSKSARDKVLLAGASSLLVASIFLSQVRSTWVACLIGIPYMAHTVKSWRRLIPVLLAAVLLIALLGALWPSNPVLERIGNIASETSSLSRRLVYWDAAWKGFLESPLIGNGYGAFQIFMPRFRDPNYWMFKAEDISEHAHNAVLEMLSEAGIIGFSVFASILFVWFASNRSSAKDNLAVRAIVASVMICLVDNLFNISFFLLPVQMTFWLLIASSAVYVPRNPRIERIVPIPKSVKVLKFPLAVLFLAVVVWWSMDAIHKVRAERAAYRGALSFYVARDRDRARDGFEEAVKEQPAGAFPLFHLGVIDYEGEKPESAVGWLRGLQRIAPFYPQSNLYLGLSYSSIGKADSALHFLQKEVRISSHPRSYLALSQLYRESEEPGEEVQALDNVIRFHRPGVDSTTIPYYEYAVERLDSLRTSKPHVP